MAQIFDSGALQFLRQHPSDRRAELIASLAAQGYSIKFEDNCIVIKPGEKQHVG